MFIVPESAAVDAALAEFTQAEAEQELREEIAELGFTAAPLSMVSQDEMLNWSLSSEPPFDNSDKGYRDALTWFSFCDVAREHRHTGHEVILVSADNDFGPAAVDGAATFHARLQRHLVEQDLDQGVSIFKSVDPVLRRLPKLAIRETLTDSERGEILFAAVEDQCLAMADQPLFWETADMEVEGWVDDLELPSVIETLTFRSVTPQLTTLSVDPAENYEDGTEVGTVMVTATAEYDGFIYKHELEDVADKVDVLDGDWNDQLMHVGGSFTAEIEFSYVLMRSGVEGMDLKRIQAIES